MIAATTRALAIMLVLWTGLVMASCAATRLTTVWKDESYRSGPLRRVFIIGVSPQPTVRRFYEDEFARQLQTVGSAGVPSYTAFPSLEPLKDKAAAAEKIRGLGADAVLVTRVLDRKTVDEYHPPVTTYAPPRAYYGGWHGHYVASYTYVTSPGYVEKREQVNIQSNLYDVENEKLIWSALSETFLEGSTQDLIRSFVGLLVKDLKAKKLI